jgi:peptidoglycan/LPS O-acetylase OafA/YrhL
MAMGVFHTRQPRRFQNPAWLVAGAAVALTYSQLFGEFGGFYGNVNAPTVNSAFWVFWPSLEGMSWAAFVLPYVHCRVSFGSLLEKCLAVLGKYSFSIYSLHLLIMFSAIRIMKTNGILLTGNPYRSGLLFGGVIVLPAAIALSALSYKVIEEPFLSMRVRYVKEAEKVARA